MATRRSEALRALVRACERAGERAGIDEWIAAEHGRDVVELRRGRSEGARDVTARGLEGEVYRDLRRGRGSARFASSADDDGSLEDALRAAAVRAGQSVGPPWSLPPPAAPARVAIADAAIADSAAWLASGAIDREPLRDAAEAILAGLDDAVRTVGGVGVAGARVEVAVESRTVADSHGFAAAYLGTRVGIDLVLAGADGRTLRVARRCRRRDDLALMATVTAAAARLQARAAARPVAPGAYDVVIRDGALTGAELGHLGDGGGFGWFAPLVAQASATTERAGLTRYRPGQAIADGSDQVAHPLTIASDGTLPYGERSAPIGDWGEPVRRFELIAAGRAAGLSLDVREAALRDVPPNGGVRNLVIDGGDDELEALLAPGVRPLLEVVELGWLETDPRTGGFVAEIGLARCHTGADTTAVVGGRLRGDAIALLARARRSRELGDERWYRGPTAWRFDDVRID